MARRKNELENFVTTMIQMRELISGEHFSMGTVYKILNNLTCKDLFWVLSDEDYKELYENRIIKPKSITYKEARKKVNLSFNDLSNILTQLKKEVGKDPQKDIMFTKTKLLTDQVFCPLRMYYKMLLSEKTTLLSTIVDRFMWGKELELYKKDEVSSFDDVYNLLYEISYTDIEPIVDERTEGITIDSLKDEEFFNTFITKVNFEEFKEKIDKSIANFCKEKVLTIDGKPLPKPLCSGTFGIYCSEKSPLRNVSKIIYKRPIYELFKRMLLNPYFLNYVCASITQEGGVCDVYSHVSKIIASINSNVKSRYLSYEANYIDIGEFVESCYALILPTIRWTFEDVRNHIFFSAVPDGIGEDFIYEFKATSSKRTIDAIYNVAIRQSNIYGVFFNKGKALIEVLVGSKFNTSKFLKKSTLQKYGAFVVEDAIEIHRVIDVDMAIFNIGVFELMDIPNNIHKLRPLSDEICEKHCPFHIREQCYYYNNEYKKNKEIKKIVDEMLKQENELNVNFIR